MKRTGLDQLVEIIKVLGTPTSEQVRAMNPNYLEHEFPQVKRASLAQVRWAESSATAALRAVLIMPSRT